MWVCVSQPRCFHSVPPAGLIDEPHTHSNLAQALETDMDAAAGHAGDEHATM